MKSILIIACLALCAWAAYTFLAPAPAPKVSPAVADNPPALEEPTDAGGARVNPAFSGLLLPHLNAAFSPLDPTKGKLRDEHLNLLRDYIMRHPAAPGADAALNICDQIAAAETQREQYRLKFGSGLNNFSKNFFTDQVERDWLALANTIAPPVQKAYADLVALERASGSRPLLGAEAFAPRFEIVVKNPYATPLGRKRQPKDGL